MKILDSVYRDIEERREKKQKELKHWQEVRGEALKEGDLSENQDYQDAMKRVKELSGEILNQQRILYNAEIVEATTLDSTIDVGTWFHAQIIYPGKLIPDSEIEDSLRNSLYYDPQKDVTIFDRDLVFGVPLDDYASEFIWSTTSLLAKFLLGKPEGSYTFTTSQAKMVTIIISPAKEKH